MACVDLDIRSFRKRGNCDVPVPKMVNLDIRDESPPNSNYAFSDLLCMPHLTQNAPSDKSSIKINVNSQLTLSPLTIDKSHVNQQCATNTDVSLGDLVNDIEAQVLCSDQNITNFSNSPLNSLKNSDSFEMKFKDESLYEANSSLSDLLSDIFIQDSDVNLQKSFNRSLSPVSNITLNDISVPELCDIEKSGSTLNSLKNSDSFEMKFKDESLYEANSSLSDLLSDIFIQDSDVNLQKNFNRSLSPVSNITLNDISVPELCDIEKSGSNSSWMQDSNVKNTPLTMEPNFNVDRNSSDLLSSLSFDNDDVAFNPPQKSFLLHSDEINMCLEDFSIDGQASKGQLSDCNAISDSNCGTAVKSLLIDCNDDSATLTIAALAKSHFLNNTNEISNVKEIETYSKNSTEKVAEVNFSFFDFSTDNVFSQNKITPHDCKDNIDYSCAMDKGIDFAKSKLDLNNDLKFSFFPESSLKYSNNNINALKNVPLINQNSNEDDVSMLDMLNSGLTLAYGTSVSASNEDTTNMLDHLNSVNTPISKSNTEDNVSMVDLFNSINTTRSNSVSESSSNLSNDVEKSENSTSDYFTLDEDDDEVILNIDLNACLKSPDMNSSMNPIDIQEQITENTTSPEIEPLKTQKGHFNCFLPLKTFIVPENSRANTKCSLFAKAVACKPKKNPSLMQKVAEVKCELFNNIFGRPVFVKSKEKPPKVATFYSDECVISCTGRRSFAPCSPCELQ